MQNLFPYGAPVVVVIIYVAVIRLRGIRCGPFSITFFDRGPTS
ncbi:hypothetical protein [Kineosporia sp. R_H_3]|nr:hypothetical protein [Kineosporia sp. R_H_3]